jgi:glycosyltransferase involved in cell wall biosynthesis
MAQSLQSDNFSVAQSNSAAIGPLVSIVTPSFNHCQFIEDTIVSVKDQTYPHIEHIIVDGGSTDGTVQMLRRYEGQYNMRWFSGPDQGQADAINKGFELAGGEILCWLNSDDTYLSASLIARIVTLFAAHPDAQIITGGARFLDEFGKPVAPFRVASGLVQHQYLRYAATIIQPATFFKREVLGQIDCDISLHYAFDWDFFIRLSENATVLPVDDFWAGYRLSGSNKTFTGGARRLAELRLVTGRYLGRWSWQYAILTGYLLVFLLSERFPTLFQQRIQQYTVLLSRKINHLTGNRVANIL